MYILIPLVKTNIGDIMSVWNINENKRKIEILENNIETDILIIGAGITGMTSAYFLKDKNICIIDSNIIGHGVTLNTTAKINYFQERVYGKISKITNKNNAIKHLNSQLLAIEKLKKIIDKENIDCDFRKVSSYVFANTRKEAELLNKEVIFLKENGIKVYEKNVPNDIYSYKSYCVDDTYTFNPIKYINGIYEILKNENIPIYENSKIVKIEKDNDYYVCYGEKYKIRAKKVVVAVHYPFFIFPFLLPLKSYIEKSYIVVSKVKDYKNYTYISSNKPTYSCRFYEDGANIYQISLAESHNSSIKQNDMDHFKKVIESFKLKKEDIIMMYSNSDIMTVDHMPYIGRLKKNMYIGVGYNTWGMTNGVLAATIISDMILKKDNEYSKVFDPYRLNIANIVSLPLIILSQIKSFLGAKINKNKNWYSNKLSFINKDGKCLAIYKDEKGISHIVCNKCPHLGCGLIFNEKEKTWDCPCHSSRFDIDGKCIKGPSNYDISYK